MALLAKALPGMPVHTHAALLALSVMGCQPVGPWAKLHGPLASRVSVLTAALAGDKPSLQKTKCAPLPSTPAHPTASRERGGNARPGEARRGEHSGAPSRQMGGRLGARQEALWRADEEGGARHASRSVRSVRRSESGPPPSFTLCMFRMDQKVALCRGIERQSRGAGPPHPPLQVAVDNVVAIATALEAARAKAEAARAKAAGERQWR